MRTRSFFPLDPTLNKIFSPLEGQLKIRQKNPKYSTKKEEISQNPLPCSTAYFHAYEDVQEIDYGQTDQDTVHKGQDSSPVRLAAGQFTARKRSTKHSAVKLFV